VVSSGEHIPNSSLKVSIVVEWENVLLAGSPRAQLMMSSLVNQCNQNPYVVEILIASNESFREQLDRPPSLDQRIMWNHREFPGSHYYQLKNQGAICSVGNRIVFIDSDVLPSPSWLSDLLSTFSSKNAQVCCGSAFIDPSNFYNKAFALFWFFPLKERSSEVQNTKHFFANNIAFNRDIFMQNPFPIGAQSSRGACLELAQKLTNKGIFIWKNPAAFVSHPPPQGLENFCLRALAQGRDRQLRTYRFLYSFLLPFFRLIKNLSFSFLKVIINYQSVSLKPFSIPFAILLAFSYYMLYFIGEIGAIFKIGRIMRIVI